VFPPLSPSKFPASFTDGVLCHFTSMQFHDSISGELATNSILQTQDTFRRIIDYFKNATFWDVAPCRSCVNRCFVGTYRLHLQDRKISERGTSVSRIQGLRETNTKLSEDSRCPGPDSNRAPPGYRPQSCRYTTCSVRGNL
jgi:hypothetical protein